MRLNGQEFAASQRKVTAKLKDGTEGTLIVESVSMADRDLAAVLFPTPPVPTLVSERKDGLRRPMPNPDDPAYQEQVERVEHRQSMFTFYLATRNTPGLEYDAGPPPGKLDYQSAEDPKFRAWAQAVVQEFMAKVPLALITKVTEAVAAEMAEVMGGLDAVRGKFPGIGSDEKALDMVDLSGGGSDEPDASAG